MNGHNFEKLDAWKRGKDLAVQICVNGGTIREFALRDQLQRSAISIPSNIAEGAERPTTPDFVRFLGYAKGSCGELRTQIMIHKEVCEELGIDPMDGTSGMIDETVELSRMISGLINSVQSQ